MLLLASLLVVFGCRPKAGEERNAAQLSDDSGHEGESMQIDSLRVSSAEFAGTDSQLPGARAPNSELEELLRTALGLRGEDYEARTHHFDEDGAPSFVNRLILEQSPYLLQHAHNPVNWYPWGDEAFARAAADDLPVLLSVGYSTCHWCHVMERESFEDEEIAAFINTNFVAIKVDREERPDVDGVYMDAVHMMRRRGGWPMTVVMTPDGEPFFAGTYFPARDGDRGARQGFLSILGQISGQWRDERAQLLDSASQVAQRLRQAGDLLRPGDVPGPEAVHTTALQLNASFDRINGGFGRAPKFPTPSKFQLLLRHYRRTTHEPSLESSASTLEHMAAGGVYDQVGGGFHRYSVDARWLVPHFEKMLYDNAQLVVAYVDAWQATGNAEFARVARETLDYVAREMTSPDGAFYSATDADSPTGDGHTEEGLFFTWTPEELAAVLDADELELVTRFYNVTEAGNFEGRNILHSTESREHTATLLGISRSEFDRRLSSARQKLYDVRATRLPPLLDDKVLTSWNGLMISAFARAGFALDVPEYVQRAEVAADWILDNLREGDRLLRRARGNEARFAAYLDDYAFLIAGLLDLFEATGDARRLREAIALQIVLDEAFRDEETGAYFITSHNHEALLARERPFYDGAEPSGNSIAAMNLLRLAEWTQNHSYRAGAERVFAAFGNQLAQRGAAATSMLAALDYYLDRPREVFVILPPDGDAPALRNELRATYLPNRVLAVLREGEQLDAARALIPLLEGKVTRGGQATVYVCEAGTCELPTSDAAEMRRQLSQVHPLMPTAEVPE